MRGFRHLRGPLQVEERRVQVGTSVPADLHRVYRLPLLVTISQQRPAERRKYGLILVPRCRLKERLDNYEARNSHHPAGSARDERTVEWDRWFRRKKTCRRRGGSRSPHASVYWTKAGEARVSEYPSRIRVAKRLVSCGGGVTDSMQRD